MREQTDFRSEVERQRPYLVRYAALQLRDADAVQDVVQETLLAALAGEADFAGRSSLRTWITGILKHKILDAFRRAQRDPLPLADGADDAADFEDLFNANGHWVQHPAAWSDPDAALEQARFFEVLEGCLQKLPLKTARAFLMREHLGVDTGDICKELGVTPSHCHVLLYRARMGLQQCLHEKWFGR